MENKSTPAAQKKAPTGGAKESDALENILNAEQLVRLECAKIVAGSGAGAYEIVALATPLSEWILGAAHQQPSVTADKA